MILTRAFKENWHKTINRLKTEYRNLTDDDLVLEDGREYELIERLQTKLGKEKEEVEKILDEVTY